VELLGIHYWLSGVTAMGHPAELREQLLAFWGNSGRAPSGATGSMVRHSRRSSVEHDGSKYGT